MAKTTEEIVAADSVQINIHTGEVITLQNQTQSFTIDVFDKPGAEEFIYLEGYPTEYRADAKLGQFKLNDKLLGDSMPMEVLKINLFDAGILNYKFQTWIQVFFLDSRGAVGHILFKGPETVRNFQSLLLDLRIERVSVIEAIIAGKMAKRIRKQDGAIYYALEFSFTKNTPARVEKIMNFLSAGTNLSCREIEDAIARSQNQMVEA